MTNKEARKLISMIDVFDGELHVHTHWGSFDDDMKEALRFAVKGLKSLGAWKNVKEDIEKQRIMVTTEAFKHDYNKIYDAGRHRGLLEALEIIDKHLAEVSE